MDSLIGPAIAPLERAMSFRVERQGLLAANVANADTPNYRRVDLHFEGDLERAGIQLARTHPSHRGGTTTGGHRLETAPRSPLPDGNGVELQSEIITLSRNAGAFTDQAAVLSRLISLARVAIVGDPGR